MNNLLYLITLILAIIWATGFFIYDANGMIHILLIIAFLPILARVIRGRDLFDSKNKSQTKF